MKTFNIRSIYFFVIFIYTATPCDILSLTNYSGNIISLVFPILFSAYMCIRYKINFLDKKFIFTIMLLSLWNIIHILCDEYYKISPFPYIEIFIAYIIIKLYSDDFAFRFEKVSVLLSKIALIGWIICLFAHGMILNIANHIGSPGASISQSLYIFSIPLRSDNVGFILRNCGFSWEPGRFSCFLLVALFFNISRNNFNLRNKNFLILFIALISAQSTTGYVIFIIMIILYYLWNKKINPIYFCISAIIISFVFTLPFMKEKIVDLFSNSLDIETQVNDLVYSTRNGDIDGYYVPQRFDGMMFQLMNLEHAPLLLGEGRDLTQFYLNREMGFHIAVSEGIFAIIIQYGIIIALCVYYLLFRSSRVLCPQCPLLFFLIFIMINFSYSLWEPPLMMAVWMYGLYNKNLDKLCH